MRIQTKKFLSMALAGAMTLSLANGFGAEQGNLASAAKGAKTASEGATTTSEEAVTATPSATASVAPTETVTTSPSATASAAPTDAAQTASPSATASAEPTTDPTETTTFDAAWVAGADHDCRIQFFNKWGTDTEVPDAFKTKATEISVSFKVSGAEAALKAANKEKAVAVLNSDTFNVWTNDNGGTDATNTTVAEITKDDTYTVTVKGDEQYDLSAANFLTIRVKDLDSLYADGAAADVVAAQPTFSDVKVTIKNDTTKPVHVDPTQAPSSGDYIDKDLWATEGHHAYLFYQVQGSWDYRNAYNKDAKEGDQDSYRYIKAAGEEVSADTVKVADVLLKADGKYTVSISGIDLSGGDYFNMLGVSTDIDAKKYPDVVIDEATVKVDGKEIGGGLTLPAKTDDYESGKYTFMAVNAYNTDLSKEADPLTKDEVGLPTDSVEISFNFSLSGKSEPTVTPSASPKATAKAPKKGDKFTVSGVKYKVTKAATSKKNGTVTVVGLSAKGKKAKSLNIKTTVKKVKKFNITKIGKSAFKGAQATKITLNKKITAIPASAFANCKKLKTLKLNAKLKSVKKKAFKGCKKKITVKGKSKKANIKKLKKSGYKKFK